MENKQSSKKNIFIAPEVTPGQQRDKVVAELSLGEKKGRKTRRNLRGEIRPRQGPEGDRVQKMEARQRGQIKESRDKRQLARKSRKQLGIRNR